MRSTLRDDTGTNSEEILELTIAEPHWLRFSATTGGHLESSIGFYALVMLSVLGTLVYHIAQKTMPRAVSPFLLLTIAFSLAAFICFADLLSTTRAPFAVWRAMSWSSVALGAAVVTIEAGYLTAYRVGWKLNRAALFSNTSVAILLIPLGMVLFQEQISFRMIAGTLLCTIGLILLVR